jgi:hypothetical protein
MNTNTYHLNTIFFVRNIFTFFKYNENTDSFRTIFGKELNNFIALIKKLLSQILILVLGISNIKPFLVSFVLKIFFHIFGTPL